MKLVRMVSSGEYSDYSIHGLLLVDTEDGDAWVQEHLKAYLDANPDQRARYHFKFHRFFEYLQARPGVEPVEFEEWNLGDYEAPVGKKIVRGEG